jgi:hypothetical protein
VRDAGTGYGRRHHPRTEAHVADDAAEPLLRRAADDGTRIDAYG